MDFDEVEQKVAQSGGELVELHAAVRQLKSRLELHSLAIQVLKEILLTRGGLREDEFLDRMQQAAAQKAADKNCRKCGKPMSAKHSRCMYCGEQRPPEFF